MVRMRRWASPTIRFGRMRRHVIVGLLFVTACDRPSPTPPAPAPPPVAHTVRPWPGDILGGPMPGRLWRLVLHRKVEEGDEWKLEVWFLPDKVIAALFYPTAGLRVTDALTPLESAEVRTLTERSRLDEGGHIGFAGLGMLETLTFQNLENRRTVVLVTVGNRNFVDDPARRSLLQRLRVLKDRLQSGSPGAGKG